MYRDMSPALDSARHGLNRAHCSWYGAALAGVFDMLYGAIGWTGQQRLLEFIETTHRNAAQPTHQLQRQRIEAPRPWNIPRRWPPAVAMDAEIFLATDMDRGLWNFAFTLS